MQNILCYIRGSWVCSENSQLVTHGQLNETKKVSVVAISHIFCVCVSLKNFFDVKLVCGHLFSQFLIKRALCHSPVDKQVFKAQILCNDHIFALKMFSFLDFAAEILFREVSFFAP